MHLLCSSPTGLEDTNDLYRFNTPPTRSRPPRTRHNSFSNFKSVGTTVKRVASFGASRTRSRHGRGLSKTLIGDPTNFVHLSHLDSSSSLNHARELVGIDINSLQILRKDDKFRPALAPITSIINTGDRELSAPSSFNLVREAQSGGVPTVPKETASSLLVSSLPNATPPATLPTTTPAAVAASAAEKAARRASMMRRKPVPIYEDDVVAQASATISASVLSSPNESSIANFRISEEPSSLVEVSA